MQKSLHHYLIESSQQYEYRIKIAGELTPEQIEKMENGFAAFDMISLSEPKRTPVQAQPLGFAGIKNAETNILDVKFNYPASTEQFMQVIKDAGIAANNIVVINKAYDDSMAEEEANKEQLDDDSSLLDSDLPNSTQAQIDASKLYSTPADQKDVIMNRASSEFEVAGEKTPKAVTTNDLPQGNTSPFANTKLPERPETGSK